MGKLIPLETTYSAIKFRSRIEARWAVYFDAAKIVWEYEPEGYCFDGLCYLPDFRLSLPTGYVWVEVKGGQPLYDRDRKCPTRDFMKVGALARESGESVFWLSGQIPNLSLDLSVHGFPVKRDTFWCRELQDVEWAEVTPAFSWNERKFDGVEMVIEGGETGEHNWLFNEEALNEARSYRF